MCVCAQSCLTLCNPMDYNLPGSVCPWHSPGKNTGVGCLVLLHRVFLTQGLNPRLLCLLHLQPGFLLASVTLEAWIYIHIYVNILIYMYKQNFDFAQNFNFA